MQRFERIEQDVIQQGATLRAQMQESREDFRSMREVLDERRDDLDALPQRLIQVERLENRLDEIPNFFRYLLQAYHELQLRNHDSAYDAVLEALELEKDNPIALYYAGWLELQYIPGKSKLGGEQEAFLFRDISLSDRIPGSIYRDP